jgi:hypothetical protein
MNAEYHAAKDVCRDACRWLAVSNGDLYVCTMLLHCIAIMYEDYVRCKRAVFCDLREPYQRLAVSNDDTVC